MSGGVRVNQDKRWCPSELGRLRSVQDAMLSQGNDTDNQAKLLEYLQQECQRFLNIKCWKTQAFRCRLAVEVCCSLSGRGGRLQPLLSTERQLMAPRPECSTASLSLLGNGKLEMMMMIKRVVVVVVVG